MWCLMGNKQLQLFMLPYAGGNAFSFYKLSRFLDSRIEAIPVEYSGRGARASEELISKYADYLKDVSKFINNHRNKEKQYGILGYSFGSVLTYDLIRKKLINGGIPQHVFFCAEGGLKHLGDQNKKNTLDNESLFEEIKKLGGFSKKLLDNTDALKDVFSLIKNDFYAYREFVYHKNTINFDCSIINSSSDFTAVCLEEWKEVAGKEIRYFQLGDNHFFINDKFRELADIVNNKLLQFLH